MSRERMAARIVYIVVFFLFIGIVFDGMSRIIRFWWINIYRARSWRWTRSATARIS